MLPAMISHETYDNLPEDAKAAIDHTEPHQLLDVLHKHRITISDELLQWVNMHLQEQGPFGYTVRAERYLGRIRLHVVKE